MEVEKSLGYYLLGPILLVVILFGLLGNGLSLVFLGPGPGDKSTVLLLRVLATVDSLLLITWLLGDVVYQFCVDDGSDDLRKWYLEMMEPYIFVYIVSILNILLVVAAWLVVLVVANRHTVVCWPLRAAKLCSRKYVIIQVTVVALMAVIINIPWCMLERISYKTVNETDEFNTTQQVTKPGWEHNVYLRDYRIIWMYTCITQALFVMLLPLLFVCIFNLRIMKALRAADSKLRMSHRAAGITPIMMLVAIIMLVICQAPRAIWYIDYAIVWSYSGGKPKSDNYLHSIARLLQATNSAVNFLIYCVVRRQFRLALQRKQDIELHHMK